MEILLLTMTIMKSPSLIKHGKVAGKVYPGLPTYHLSQLMKIFINLVTNLYLTDNPLYLLGVTLKRQFKK